MNLYPYILHEVSVLIEFIFGHLRYLVTDVPPQPNSPPDNVFKLDQFVKNLNARKWTVKSNSTLLNK